MESTVRAQAATAEALAFGKTAEQVRSEGTDESLAVCPGLDVAELVGGHRNRTMTDDERGPKRTDSPRHQRP